MASSRSKQSSNFLAFALVGVGLLALVFSFGKSLVDLINAPELTIDIEEDDQIVAGFLPVYVEEDVQANADTVAIDYADLPSEVEEEAQVGQAFPTPMPESEAPAVVERDPGLPPDRLVIPSIELDAAITPVEFVAYKYGGEDFQQWLAPETRTVGWHDTSVGLGVPGNTVLNGHHNIKGMVFRNLYQVQVGDSIQIYSGDQRFDYVVVHTDILPERNQPIEVRLANAEWIKETEDERVTLITCWPFESNTHRVIVVAVPIRDNELAN